MLEISEIFCSIQGEGYRQGIPAIFIRLYGCNLNCKFCDTPQAFKKKRLMQEKEIIEKVEFLAKKKAKISNVIITGGEPYLQDFSLLAELLKKNGYFVAVETNGTIWREIDLDWICISPKRDALKLMPSGYDKRFKKVASEFKYVITKKSDILFVDKSIDKPVILQPVNNNLRIASMILMEIKKAGMPNWFIRLQLHKVMKLR
ncbi:MAG: 7-carboxy-7-deazaguanine synthase QueE [Candidatus Omnitrophica bacterium]|nr:7-carboxy-7-deazaguanine synthase QueE [Candidatus Omnitrophota bacterium]